MSSPPVESLVDSAQHAESLIVSGSDEFDLQTSNARQVIDRAKSRYGPDQMGEDLFPRGRSVLREIYEAGITAFTYGQYGLSEAAVSAVHVASTFDHTPNKQHLFKRLVGTGITLHTMITGSVQEVFNEADRLQLGHSRVRGHLRADTGAQTAGTAYSAHDPKMMKYTAFWIADGLLSMHEAQYGPQDEGKRNAFCQEAATLFEFFGLPSEDFPQTYQEFQEYKRKLFDSRELKLSDTGKEAGLAILDLPVQAKFWLGKVLVDKPLVLGALDPEVREMYGIRYDGLDKARFSVAKLFARMVGAALPNKTRMNRVVPIFNMVERAEASRIKHNRPLVTIPENPYP